MSILREEYKYYRIEEVPSIPLCVISELNRYHNKNCLNHLPDLPNLIISSYCNDLYSHILEFERKYSKVRRQIKSIVYSIAI